MPLAGGSHTVAAPWKLLTEEDSTAYRQLTIRVEDNAAGNVEVSLDGDTTVMFLKTDESFTFGPDAGTVTPKDLYLKGTAADIVYYLGVPV